VKEVRERELTTQDIVKILSDPRFFANLHVRAVDTAHPEDKEQNEAAATIVKYAQVAKATSGLRRQRAKTKLGLALHSYIIKYFPNL
jgi:hypothetical protein